jgi:enoyl-CoA hydratase
MADGVPLVRLDDVTDGVATIVLDNPPMNALSFAAQEQLDEILRDVEQRDDVRAVVVTGAGRVFSAGAEIGELEDLRRPGESRRIVARLHAILDRLEHLPQPSIAAIDGAAVGGGTELALACTFRVAGQSAKLGLPEVGLGVVPGGGGPQRLPALVGAAVALELILTGRLVAADEARDIGLVHRVVEKRGARAAASAWARELAARPKVAVQAAKRAVLAAGTDDGYAAEVDAFAAVAASADMLEGVNAFLEKRPPAFSHR